MITIDTNFLVLAHRGDAPDHETAIAALRPILEGPSPWALPWPCIHDARIAALCLHHGVRELCTADRDFSLFPQLKARNPLVET